MPLAALRKELADLTAIVREVKDTIPVGDPFGANIPSPIARPGAGGFEWVPAPGTPDEYPWYLKPIPVNVRDIEKELSDVLRRREPVLMKWLYSTWNADSDAIKDQELRNAIRDGEFSEAWLNRWQQRYANFINIRLVGEWSRASQAASKLWKVGLERLHIDHGFELLGHRLDQWVAFHGGELAVALSQAQHQALRNVLRYHTVQKPISESQLAKLLRPVIGLTPKQADAVRRFREQLVEEGELTLAQVEHRVQNNASWQRRIRAKRMARTELATAYNYGGYYTMKDAVDAGAFEDVVIKQWHTQEDERVCPWCGPLHEQIVGMEETYPGLTQKVPNVLVPPAHPNCRCLVLYHERGEPKDVGSPPETQPEPKPKRPTTLDPARATALDDDFLPETATSMDAATWQDIVNDERAQIEEVLDLTDKQQAELPGIANGSTPSQALQRKMRGLLGGLRDDSRDYRAEAPFNFMFQRRRRYQLGNKDKDAVERARRELNYRIAPINFGRGTKWEASKRIWRELDCVGENTAAHDPQRRMLYAPRRVVVPALRRALELDGRGKLAYRDMIWHELGHELEARNRRVALAARRFFQLRTAGQIPHYRHGYRAMDDKWWHPYQGRLYSTASTELVSMGFECLSNTKRATALYARDPEHFSFIIAVLRGRFGYSPGLKQ